ncbi:MAG TPA: membrane protein insertase YidC [Pseudomonadales bacterium]|nr:membrane protein insertase YidC [Pseudomonadales bacterium]
MDKTGITVIVLCLVLLGVWFYESEKYENYVAQQKAAAQASAAAAQPSPSTTPPAFTAATTNAYSFLTNAPEQTLTLTGPDTNSPVRYIFTSRGGGIKSVELLHYPETISPRWKPANTDEVVALNAGAPVPIMSILGDPGLVGDGDFTLRRMGDGVEAEKPLPNGLVITKDFRLSSNYLVSVDVTVKNESGQPVPLLAQDWVVGTATPMDGDDANFPTYGGTMWCDGATYYPYPPTYFVTNTTILGIIPRTPKTELTAGCSNVVWAASYNQFFVLLGMPGTNQVVKEMMAVPVSLAITNNVSSTPWIGVQTALVFPPQMIGAGQAVEHQLLLYAGPKKFQTLAKIGDDLQNHADLAMNFGKGYTGFWGIGSFFAKILLLLMNWLHSLLPAISYGWIIVLLTVLLRAVFWPITRASMRSAKKMQALSPELKTLKDKYKDDPTKYMQKQSELFRQNGVSPLSGCLPALIQMPVFLGFFTMIRSAIELRGAHFLWVADLSKPDTLFVIPGITHIPFSTPYGFPINVLPLIMVGVMVWQAHLQPVSPGVDPAQQKMMRYMPLFFLLFLYSYSAGMALYMTISTLLGILQIRLIKNLPVAPVSPLAPALSPLTPAPKRKK